MFLNLAPAHTLTHEMDNLSGGKSKRRTSASVPRTQTSRTRTRQRTISKEAIEAETCCTMMERQQGGMWHPTKYCSPVASLTDIPNSKAAAPLDPWKARSQE
ncbi:hypothetical protein LTR28_007143 [Elasticomyces elasticus]|nr:hypothetical protein LTR28_007143 [Elasticomyces elasticus]